MKNAIRATYERGDAFRLSVRGHDVMTDQPTSDGGEDLGASPTELFIGSLVTCMGFFGARFLQRNGVSAAGLEVEARYELSEDRPVRVSRVVVNVEVPRHVPVRLIEALPRVMDRCTVHNTLRQAPVVEMALRPAKEVEAVA